MVQEIKALFKITVLILIVMLVYGQSYASNTGHLLLCR
jgi:hypothetical protein